MAGNLRADTACFAQSKQRVAKMMQSSVSDGDRNRLAPTFVGQSISRTAGLPLSWY